MLTPTYKSVWGGRARAYANTHIKEWGGGRESESVCKHPQTSVWGGGGRARAYANTHIHECVCVGGGEARA